MSYMQKFVDRRMTISEIADEAGIKYDSARARLHRAGIKTVREDALTIEDKIRRMDPDEAVEYLLFVIQCLNDSMANGAHHPIDDLNLKITWAPRLMLICLWDANGRIKSVEELHSAVMVGKTDVTSSPKLVDQYLVRARKALKGTPYYIKNFKGIGWSLQRVSPPT